MQGLLHTTKALRRERLVARDGAAGSLVDVYFEDLGWEVRYLVVRTGWLGGQVLITPASVDGQRSGEGVLRLKISRKDLRASPSSENELPVWRQAQLADAMRLGYPYYWSDLALSGFAGGSHLEAERAAHAALARGDPHLRSARALRGCRVEARDGGLGTLEDFVVDEGAWTVPKLVIDTRRWRPGGRIRISTALVTRIDWPSHEIAVSLTRGAVLSRPAPRAAPAGGS